MIPNMSYPISGVSPIKVGGTGTAVKVFPAVAASLPSNPAQPIAPGQQVGGPAALLLPSNGSFEGQPFRVVMAGTVAFGATASPAIDLQIYVGSSLTATSDTLLVSLNAPPTLTASTVYSFTVALALQGDTFGDGSANLVPIPDLSAAQINGTAYVLSYTPILYTTNKSFSFMQAASTGQNPIFNGNAGSGVSIVCAVAFGQSDAANLATLKAFYID